MGSQGKWSKLNTYRYGSLILKMNLNVFFSLKAQLLFMGILIIALANFIVGSALGPTSVDELSKGFVGYNRKRSKIKISITLLFTKLNLPYVY
jgi:hypothetical protein